MRIRKQQISILVKSIAFFLLIIIPLYAYNIWTQIKEAENKKNEFSDTILYQMDMSLKNLENAIRRITEMQGQLITRHDFIKLGLYGDKVDSYNTIRIITNLQNELQVIKNISPFIEEVDVHFPSINRSINNAGFLYDLNTKKLSALHASKSFPFVYWEGNLYTNVKSENLMDVSSKTPILDIAVRLSLNRLKDTLLGFMETEGGFAVLINQDVNFKLTKGINVPDTSEIDQFIQQKSPLTNDTKLKNYKLDNKNYLTAYKHSPYLNTALLVFLPEEQITKPLSTYYRGLWLISLYAFVIILLFSLRMYSTIEKPLIKLLTAFRSVQKGQLDVSIQHKANDEFHFIYAQFNTMVTNLDQLIRQIYEHKIRTQEAELKQLQYQISPHFLYNCLNIISSMIDLQDYASASRFTSHLGNYYQYITKSNTEEVYLQQEVSHVGVYAEIQSLRDSERITVELGALPSAFRRMLVPRLILQPLVENAYKHGLKCKDAEGLIKVSFGQEESYLNIMVEDNGEDLTEETLEKIKTMLSTSDSNNVSSGLMNVHQRLRIRYGPECGIFASKSEMGGLMMRMKIRKGA